MTRVRENTLCSRSQTALTNLFLKSHRLKAQVVERGRKRAGVYVTGHTRSKPGCETKTKRRTEGNERDDAAGAALGEQRRRAPGVATRQRRAARQSIDFSPGHSPPTLRLSYSRRPFPFILLPRHAVRTHVFARADV